MVAASGKIKRPRREAWEDLEDLRWNRVGLMWASLGVRRACAERSVPSRWLRVGRIRWDRTRSRHVVLREDLAVPPLRIVVLRDLAWGGGGPWAVLHEF